MSPSDANKDHESRSDSAREVDREKEREKDKGTKVKGPSKTKDLSHVPCKFFKVGSCTAGSSCPFSHNILEPGQQKEICAWFVKGNCKFGHKCALAHILPGQSMSMDRKNKKAAQLAANASNAGGGTGRDGSKGGGRQKGATHGGGGGGSQTRNTLLSGSTAPTRTLSGASRSTIPMPLKATLSPPTPAPPVKDTDFVSFGLPDETSPLPSAPAQGKSSTVQTPSEPPPSTHDTPQEVTPKAQGSPNPDDSVPSPIPTSTPTAPRRVGDTQRVAPKNMDFGPIGSPPRPSPSNQTSRVNGFSPGTSPHGPGISSSPFSAPGTQSAFAVYDSDDTSLGFTARSGLSASLGAMMNRTSDRSYAHNRPSGLVQAVASEVVVEDEDLEEFLPSSLTDLLTPEERSRRFSRTNGTRPTVSGVERDMAAGHRPVTEGHHRYSRSVPAPSLLQDLKSIWADDGAAGVGSPGVGGSALSGTGSGLGNGTPSSFQSNSGLVGRPSGEDILSPSNASAAFLPGLHYNYLNSTAQHANLLSGTPSVYPSTNVSHNMYSGAYGAGLNGGTLSPPRTDAFGSRPSFDTPSSDLYFTPVSHRRAPGRPIPGGNDACAPDVDDRRNALSPSARALQSHAPGQSLPQGLAAGYSRIHALPPPIIASPSTSGAFNVGQGGYSPNARVLGHSQSASGDWHSASSSAVGALDHAPVSQVAAQTTTSAMGGLEAMFSRLSYSAATSRGGGAPAGIGSRNPSGRGYAGQGSLSPLSGPVLTGDDDDLFSMDG
ncbi:hypothetical protein BKA93DRAFT_887554 [Sparassis latifolia]